MKYKSLLALLLAFVLCLGLAACGNQGESDAPEEPSGAVEESNEPEAAFPANPIGTNLGDGMADFSFTTFDGKTYSLYETLQEKKMVLVRRSSPIWTPLTRRTRIILRSSPSPARRRTPTM